MTNDKNCLLIIPTLFEFRYIYTLFGLCISYMNLPINFITIINALILCGLR